MMKSLREFWKSFKRILEKKEADHEATYYYFMACQLVEDLKKEMKEISKQNKYLWHTLKEVIEQLKELKK